MTVKLLQREFTLFLEKANLRAVSRKRCFRGTCTVRYLLTTLGALRSEGRAFPRASAVTSFWQSLGRCVVLQALADAPPAISTEQPNSSAPILKGHGGLYRASALVCCE